MMMIVLHLLLLPGRDRGVSQLGRNRWIRGLLAQNPCAIGIQPVHTRVDSGGLPPRDVARQGVCGISGISATLPDGGAELALLALPRYPLALAYLLLTLGLNSRGDAGHESDAAGEGQVAGRHGGQCRAAA